MFDKDDVSNKNLLVCTLLAFFFGGFGAHRFYVGKWKTGLIYFAFNILPFFSPAICAYLNFDSIFASLKLTLLTALLSLCVAVAVIYDIYAMYSESFFDKQGKIILSESARSECVGSTYAETYTRKLDAWIIVFAFIAFLGLYIACTVIVRS